MTARGAVGSQATEWEALVERLRQFSRTLDWTCREFSTVGMALAIPPIDQPTEPRDLAGIIIVRADLDNASLAVREAVEEVTYRRRRRLRTCARCASQCLERASGAIEDAVVDLPGYPAIEVWFSLVAYPIATRLFTLLADSATLARDLGAFGQ